MFRLRKVIKASSNDFPQPAKGKINFKSRKFYAALTIVAVGIIAITLFIPQGVAAIPLVADYQVGEKMVYNTIMTGTVDNFDTSLPYSMGSLSNMTVDSTQTIDVIDFDGEYYTLNHTTTMELMGKPISLSVLEKMNKTGYSTFMLNVDSSQAISSTGISGDSYLTQLLSKDEVKVGDSITVPYPSAVSSMGIKGDLTITFEGIEDITVPAGTYKVVKVSITTDSIQMELPSANMSSNTDLNYTILMEYGTMRQIKSTMQETVAFQSSTINYTMHLTMDMTLNQHLKP